MKFFDISPLLFISLRQPLFLHLIFESFLFQKWRRTITEKWHSTRKFYFLSHEFADHVRRRARPGRPTDRQGYERRWCWRRRCCQVTAISRHRPIEWKQSATVSFSNEWELYESCWQRERGVGIRERESTIYTEREDRKSLARRWQGPLKKCRPFCFNVFVVSLDQTKD